MDTASEVALEQRPLRRRRALDIAFAVACALVAVGDVVYTVANALDGFSTLKVIVGVAIAAIFGVAAAVSSIDVVETTRSLEGVGMGVSMRRGTSLDDGPEDGSEDENELDRRERSAVRGCTR